MYACGSGEDERKPKKTHTFSLFCVMETVCAARRDFREDGGRRVYLHRLQ